MKPLFPLDFYSSAKSFGHIPNKFPNNAFSVLIICAYKTAKIVNMGVFGHIAAYLHHALKITLYHMNPLVTFS